MTKLTHPSCRLRALEVLITSDGLSTSYVVHLHIGGTQRLCDVGIVATHRVEKHDKAEQLAHVRPDGGWLRRF